MSHKHLSYDVAETLRVYDLVELSRLRRTYRIGAAQNTHGPRSIPAPCQTIPAPAPRSHHAPVQSAVDYTSDTTLPVDHAHLVAFTARQLRDLAPYNEVLGVCDRWIGAEDIAHDAIVAFLQWRSGETGKRVTYAGRCAEIHESIHSRPIVACGVVQFVNEDDAINEHPAARLQNAVNLARRVVESVRVRGMERARLFATARRLCIARFGRNYHATANTVEFERTADSRSDAAFCAVVDSDERATIRAKLTPRQREVFDLVSSGYCTSEIAVRTGTEIRAVQTTLNRIAAVAQQ